MMNDDVMLDYADAAALTGIKLNTLYSMVAKKQIPHVRITTRLVRFSRRALLAWLEERTVTPDLPPTDATIAIAPLSRRMGPRVPDEVRAKLEGAVAMLRDGRPADHRLRRA